MERKRIERRAALGIALGALALFLAGSALPATYFTGNDDVYVGYQYLACGWMGPCNSAAPLWGWYANPLFLTALILMMLRRGFTAAVLAGLGFAIALQSLQLVHGLAPNEGGVVTLDFVGWGPGFFLWLASQGVLFVGGLAFGIWQRRRAQAAASERDGAASTR
ncbi:MAG TPA: hypothetical protein RMH85_12310 [Polyangiaceae bacterium LLY-WYZ-15_(1-7)]|nr:hypothetical protein [Myxococcales bacterium]MAT25946.1 hypothetical protein [Sandaracinus sp.]HJK89639.1 hypothetical protein [Polyangiaceae bacterium LLY-WYZ-15_(1-7)]MBJ71337.1 hypothetical protein [Sandaracinus sp.]HJL02249.1 hypothetical protein [Polyangiaceae bacterium LLY-WYZ-15_(1-7)]